MSSIVHIVHFCVCFPDGLMHQIPMTHVRTQPWRGEFTDTLQYTISIRFNFASTNVSRAMRIQTPSKLMESHTTNTCSNVCAWGKESLEGVFKYLESSGLLGSDWLVDEKASDLPIYTSQYMHTCPQKSTLHVACTCP